MRQKMLKNWGESGQKRLQESRVLIAGAGGLGSPVALYLASAGVGSITICDMDCVDWSNLNRQILHTPQRIGLNKAISAAQTLSQFNQDIVVHTVTEKIDKENVGKLVKQSDIIVDCLDNFEARYLLMEQAVLYRVPYVYASVWGMEGRLTFFYPPDTPCLQCVFPESPVKEEIPIVGATAGKIIKRINSKRVTTMRRKLKKLAVKVKNEEISYENVENMFRGWMGGFYKLLSREQRKNLIGLYEDLFEKSITIVNKKIVVTDKIK